MYAHIFDQRSTLPFGCHPSAHARTYRILAASARRWMAQERRLAHLHFLPTHVHERDGELILSDTVAIVTWPTAAIALSTVRNICRQTTCTSSSSAFGQLVLHPMVQSVRIASYPLGLHPYFSSLPARTIATHFMGSVGQDACTSVCPRTAVLLCSLGVVPSPHNRARLP